MEPDVAIWQGYHHEWEYNHRVNRFGSYIRHDNNRPIIGHTAASGTGADVAHFTEYGTAIKANGVYFQSGMAETVVDCPRTEHTDFRMDIRDLLLDEGLQNKDTYTVIINGFDLVAKDHSDKLIHFDLEATEPTVTTNGTKIRFNILGGLCVDCRSPECQLFPVRLEVENVENPDAPQETKEPIRDSMPHTKRGIEKHRVDSAFKWFKNLVVRLTNLEEVKQSVIGHDTDTMRRRVFRIFGKRFFLKLLKWRITTPYILRVHYVIVAGNSEDLAVTESGFHANNYSWDMENEIQLDDCGTQTVHVKGQPTKDYAVNILAFKHLTMTVKIDEKHGTSDPIQWGKGMHFLNWSAAVRNIETHAEGVTANLDLFYKCWNPQMNEVITFTTWGAFRAAGCAEFRANLTLLQIRDGQQWPITSEGFISWPGGGLSAKNHPRAVYERSWALPS